MKCVQECVDKYEEQVDYNQLMRRFLWDFCEDMYYIYVNEER